MAMKNPPHPGEVIREDIIGALGLTVPALLVFLVFAVLRFRM